MMIETSFSASSSLRKSAYTFAPPNCLAASAACLASTSQTATTVPNRVASLATPRPRPPQPTRAILGFSAGFGGSSARSSAVSHAGSPAAAAFRTVRRERVISRMWALSLLMVEHELAGVQDRPEDVFQSLLPVLRCVHHREQLLHLVRPRGATETPVIQLLDDERRRPLFLQHPADDVPLCHLRRHRLAVHQVQTL